MSKNRFGIVATIWAISGAALFSSAASAQARKVFRSPGPNGTGSLVLGFTSGSVTLKSGGSSWELVNVAGGAWLIKDDSGRCLDESSPRDGAFVYTFPGHGRNNQRWKPYPANSTSFQLINQEDGRCLDVTALQYYDGAPIEVWSCNGGWNQKWSF